MDQSKARRGPVVCIKKKWRVTGTMNQSQWHKLITEVEMIATVLLII